MAFFQCQFDLNQLKPTRLLSNFAGVTTIGFLGPPSFDHDGWYLGPLPKTCSHGGHPPLIKRAQSGSFRTGLQAYPPSMVDVLAAAIFSTSPPNRSSEGVIAVGETPNTAEFNPGSSENPGDRKEGLLNSGNSGAEETTVGGHRDGPGNTGTIEDSGCTGQEEDKGAVAFMPGGGGISGATPGVAGRGMLKACYKGRTRPFHDGLGLCSVGRLKSEDRPRGKASGAFMEVKEIFWGELENWLGSLGKAGELKVMATVLCGRLDGSPFGTLPERIRAKWVERLAARGLAAIGRRSSSSGFSLPWPVRQGTPTTLISTKWHRVASGWVQAERSPEYPRYMRPKISGTCLRGDPSTGRRSRCRTTTDRLAITWIR